MSRLSKSGTLFLDRTGKKGLGAYKQAQKVKSGNLFLDSFKRNPGGTIGASRFHALLAGTKFVKKEGLINTALIAVSALGWSWPCCPTGPSGPFSGSPPCSFWAGPELAASARIPAPEEVEGPSIEFPGPAGS